MALDGAMYIVRTLLPATQIDFSWTRLRAFGRNSSTVRFKSFTNGCKEAEIQASDATKQVQNHQANEGAHEKAQKGSNCEPSKQEENS